MKASLSPEIELSSPDEDFEKPSWVGKEVSDDIRYYNVFLLSILTRTGLAHNLTIRFKLFFSHVMLWIHWVHKSI